MPSQPDRLYVFLITVTAAIAGLLFGFDTGVISGALEFIAKTFHIQESEVVVKEIIVSAVPIGALFGALLSGKAANTLGRRRSILLSAGAFIIGTLITALADNAHHVILGRLVLGLSVGVSAMIVPMYLSEISPPKVRGMAVFVFQLAITVGIMMAFIINYLFSDAGNWRMMFAIGLIPSVILGIGMFLLPYSPRWLVLKGKEAEAKKILEKLDSALAEKEMAEIKASVAHAKVGVKELFTRRMFPLVVITFGLFVFQQLTGINTIFYYAPTVFKSAGFVGDQGAILASVATGVCNVLSTFVGIALVDRWGRRKLLKFGMVGMIICLSILGLGYHDVFGHNIATLTIIAVLTFIFFFATSIAGCAYLVMSEIFPLRLRGAGMATASCANWGFNILVSATFLSLIQAIGIGNTFLLYAAATFIGLLFIWFLLPETRGVTLEHIEADLFAGKPIRKLGDSPAG